MSVIIQGLNLPAYQGEHKEFDRYGCFLTVYKTGKIELHIFEKDFDVKDIPAPHGRLIDADAFVKKLKRLESSEEPYQRGLVKAFLSVISCEPIIIEAEE